MEKQPPAFLTVSEVAAQLRISRTTVYELMASGKLGSAKFGRTRRIATADLDRYISSSTTPPKEQ